VFHGPPRRGTRLDEALKAQGGDGTPDEAAEIDQQSRPAPSSPLPTGARVGKPPRAVRKANPRIAWGLHLLQFGRIWKRV